MWEQKKETKKEEVKKEEPKIREILIETDWNVIQIKKLEVAWIYEAKAIFDSVVSYLERLSIKQ